MKRLFLIAGLLPSFLFSILIQDAGAMQSEQDLITITVSDDYTDNPVEGIQVRLLKDGSELATGTTDAAGTTELQVVLTSTEETRMDLPETFQVSDSYPNPFESQSSVELSVDERQEVTAEVFNIIGQRVASLQVVLNPGSYTLQSSLGHLAQGVYFLRIFGQQVQTVKMTKVGQRIYSGDALLEISQAALQTTNGPGMAALALDEHENTELTLVASGNAYDTVQQSIEVSSDTTFSLQLSRNNEVVFRVADETSPESNIQIPVNIASGNFSTEITTPDTLTLKSGTYSVTAEEGDTEAIDEEIEIASEDQTVTVLTQVKSLAENQLQLQGSITDESSGSPVNRAYIYLLNQTTSDTLAGPIFAGSDGVLDAIANLDNGPDLDLSILYRKAGFNDFESTASVSLPDTLTLHAALQSAPAPTADFTVSGDLIAGSPIIFDASASSGASGEDLTYSWDFGNGKRGYGQILSHVYTGSGNFSVTLTVAGELGSTDQATEPISVSSAPSPPALTIINGEITSVDLEPLEGVTANVVNDDFTSVSGTDGRVVLGDVPAGVPIVVQLTKPGYALQTVRITPDAESAENYFSTSMIELENPVTVQNVENGTSVTGKFGTKVSLPIDGLIDSDGGVVTGDVDLTLTPLDVSSDEIFSFPGGFEGVRPTGEQGNIVSFGVADFTFTQNGETLQMMPGKSAEIEIPVTNADVGLGDIIPLWTLDEETGLWIEEGTGEIIASANSPSGLAMVAGTG
ncbi:MAG: PKD domain-containing protein, partial [Bacteroidota bacterium]